jgi:hypothetical protein
MSLMSVSEDETDLNWINKTKQNNDAMQTDWNVTFFLFWIHYIIFNSNHKKCANILVWYIYIYIYFWSDVA